MTHILDSKFWDVYIHIVLPDVGSVLLYQIGAEWLATHEF